MKPEPDSSAAHVLQYDGGGLLKRCAGCRAVGYDDDIYCPQCGALFGPICRRCAAPVRHPVAIYCVRCGEKLNDDAGRHRPAL